MAEPSVHGRIHSVFREGLQPLGWADSSKTGKHCAEKIGQKTSWQDPLATRFIKTWPFQQPEKELPWQNQTFRSQKMMNYDNTAR
ncbi:hypothetical protein BCA33_06840 [Marinobacter sp. AC-23]|nr:hypothetical protein BCA33_06840 [Marinobacter sp. AC-23]